MADVYLDPSGVSFTTSEVVTASKLQSYVLDNMQAVKAGLVGDGSADSDIRHRHGSGTLASRPSAGNAGRLYYATDLGAVFIDNGTRWDVFNVIHRIASHVWDDFSFNADSDTTFTTLPAGLNWRVATESTGSFGFNSNSSRDELLFTTGGTINSVVSLIEQEVNGNYDISSRSPAIWSSIMSPVSLTQTQTLIGLVEIGGTGFTPGGVYFKRTDVGSAANWRAVCRTGGIETNVDTTIVGSGVYRFFEIVVESASSVKFYIDGVERAAISTNIPASQLLMKFFISNTEAVSKSLKLDMTELIWKR